MTDLSHFIPKTRLKSANKESSVFRRKQAQLAAGAFGV